MAAKYPASQHIGNPSQSTMSTSMCCEEGVIWFVWRRPGWLKFAHPVTSAPAHYLFETFCKSTAGVEDRPPLHHVIV
eukprot:351140-Chlamydomonas_euryale.AAC.15